MYVQKLKEESQKHLFKMIDIKEKRTVSVTFIVHTIFGDFESVKEVRF